MSKPKKPKLLCDLHPLIYYISIGYVVVNILFAIGLFLSHFDTGYLIVGSHFGSVEWGIVFVLLSLLGWYALIADKWNLVKHVLEGGLVVKSLWFFALLFHTNSGESLITLSMWTFLAYVQLLTVIFFPDK